MPLWHFYTMSTYHTIAWKEDGTWTAHAPSVPGVYGLGRTRRQAEDDLVEALELMFDYLDEVGDPRPAPSPVVHGEVRL